MSGTDGINLEKQIEIYYPSGRNLPLVFKTSLGATHLHLTQSSVLHNWCVLGGRGDCQLYYILVFENGSLGSTAFDMFALILNFLIRKMEINLM